MNQYYLFSFLFCTLLLVGSCGTPADIHPDTDATATTTHVEPINVEDANRSPKKTLTAQSAKRLLHQWQEAQNKNNYHLYESLYATRFHALQHKPYNTYRFVRDQWLVQKESLFSKDIHLTLEDIILSLLPGIAIVTFKEILHLDGSIRTQPKKMTFVEEDGQLQIATEVSYESLPKEKNRHRKEKYIKDLFLILDDRYVVFKQTDIDPKGALYVNDSTAIKPARREQFSKQIRRLMKRKFVIGFADGSTEIVKMRATRAIAKYKVHFGASKYWKQHGYTEVERGEAIWKMANQAGSVYLTGMLESRKKGALWAFPKKPRLPKVYSKTKLKGNQLKNIKKRLRRRETYKTLQQHFVQTNHLGRWIDFEPSIQGNIFTGRGGAGKFAAATFTAGKGCGDFFGAIQGFYHIQKGVLYDLGFSNDFFQDPFIDSREIVAAIDVDHDGIPEFVGQNKFFYRIDDNWYVYEIYVPTGDSPC